jgi:hypothetical protein
MLASQQQPHAEFGGGQVMAGRQLGTDRKRLIGKAVATGLSGFQLGYSLEITVAIGCGKTKRKPLKNHYSNGPAKIKLMAARDACVAGGQRADNGRTSPMLSVVRANAALRVRSHACPIGGFLTRAGFLTRV